MCRLAGSLRLAVGDGVAGGAAGIFGAHVVLTGQRIQPAVAGAVAGGLNLHRAAVAERAAAGLGRVGIGAGAVAVAGTGANRVIGSDAAVGKVDLRRGHAASVHAAVVDAAVDREIGAARRRAEIHGHRQRLALIVRIVAGCDRAADAGRGGQFAKTRIPLCRRCRSTHSRRDWRAAALAVDGAGGASWSGPASPTRPRPRSCPGDESSARTSELASTPCR